VIETRLSFDRLLVTTNRRTGTSGDAALSLVDSLAFAKGLAPVLAGDAGRPCEFSPNWQLTVMRSAVCDEKSRQSCNLATTAWLVLESIAAKADKFSLRGFMSKVAKLCKKITSRYIIN